MANTVISSSGYLQIESTDGTTTDTIQFGGGTIERLSDSKVVLFDGDAEPPLGYTAEDQANKTSTITNSATQYPSGAAITAAGYVNSAGAAAAAPVQTVAGRAGTVVLTKADVGLSNVDNTSDINKPVSTAVQAALDLKMNNSTTSGAGFQI